MVHMTFYILIKGYTVPGTQGTHGNLNQIRQNYGGSQILGMVVICQNVTVHFNPKQILYNLEQLIIKEFKGWLRLFYNFIIRILVPQRV